MIDVDAVLRDIPFFNTFCSVGRLKAQVDSLRDDTRFDVREVGTSVNGVPIHHVTFGSGAVRALFVAHQHCMEPMTGLTISSLLTLLRNNHPALVNQDVEWHFVPCIDPDGALLNEGWTQNPFTFQNYMRNLHQQPFPEQVDTTFPVHDGGWVWDKPSKEARVLMDVIDQVKPDFFYSGHDARPMTGSWFNIRNDIDPSYYKMLRELLNQLNMPMAVSMSRIRSPRVGECVYRLDPIQTLPTGDSSARGRNASVLQAKIGVASYHYLARQNPDALMLTGELTYIRYLGSDMLEPSGMSRRKIRLGTLAENKIIAGAILDEWDGVEADLDETSPFFRKIHSELIESRDDLPDGLLEWYEFPRISWLLSDPFYAGMACRGEWLDAMIGVTGRFGFLCQAYEFVRLLKVSKQSQAVRDATARLEAVFDAALADIDAQVDLRRFEPVDCTTLAKAHAGGALIVLNALLEKADDATSGVTEVAATDVS